MNLFLATISNIDRPSCILCLYFKPEDGSLEVTAVNPRAYPYISVLYKSVVLKKFFLPKKHHNSISHQLKDLKYTDILLINEKKYACDSKTSQKDY